MAPPGRARVALPIAAIVLGLMAAWLMAKRHQIDQRASSSVKPDVPSTLESDRKIYAGSASCQSCHEEEYQLWLQSHHGLAERPPEPALDDAAFNPARTFRYGNQTTSVRKTGSQYEVETDGSAGTQELFRVERVIGVSPLRQFLVAFAGGRFQTLADSYDPRSNQWFNVYGNEDRGPGDWGHWTGRGMNWNSMCSSCHNTRLHKNYDQVHDLYHTTLFEAAVGCEACHGPLRAHNNWQKRFGNSGQKDPTLPRWPPARVLDNCGFCHARRGDLTGNFRTGDDFLNHLRPEIVDGSELFYPDGQVREEDYEYAAFLGSRMHLRGVQCTDCHNPHSARTILPGNWLCMRCHNGSYTNAPIIEPVSHSHHKVFGYDATGALVNADLMAYQPDAIKETGGECVNCHMPQTVYMQRHVRHDHGFTTPDPFLTKAAGIPNACNRCHRDKDADWALRSCEEWYGPKMQRGDRSRALLIAAARKNDATARPGLLRALQTNEIPYWRAVAAGLLEPWAGEPPVRDALLLALKDTNALVRIECVRALESLAAAPEVAVTLRRSLDDPVRGVRVAAAWAVRSNLDLSCSAALELLHSLEVNSDQPMGQMQLGAMALARGDAAKAAGHYQKAAEWDPNSAIIRHDYAVVLAGLNRPREAVEQLQAACQIEPTNAELQYNLALGWNELGQGDKTIECLEKAVHLNPNHAAAWYNLGLALESAGRTPEALDALIRAESADGSDPRSPYARATILARLGRVDEARRAARRALEINQGFNPAHELLRELPPRE